MSLSKESTLKEVFEFLDTGDEGVQVVPVTIEETADKAQLAIFINGHRDTASVIYAELIYRLGELSDLEAQSESSQIIT